MIGTQCLLVAAFATVATSVQVSQDDYARYLSQQHTQRLEEKILPEKIQSAARRPVLLQVAPSAYQPTAAPPAPRPPPTLPEYRPQQQQQQQYQPQAYVPQPSYQSPQAYQQPEEYQQQYQPAPTRPVGPRPKAGPMIKAQMRPEDEESDNNPNAQYQFSFDISDDDSTNYHNRKEQRDGEKISGSYSVVDSDGFIRTVTYTADPEQGFKAEVSREPTNIQVKIPTPAPQTPAPASQYRLSERKPQPQYIQASVPESDEQSADPLSGYYRPVPQQVKAPAHRFAAPRPQQSLQAGSKAASAVGYATAPNNQPILYQAYQQ